MSSLTLGYIALQQVHGVSISKCRLQPVKQVAYDRQRIRWPGVAPCWHGWCDSSASRNVIKSSATSTVASDAWLCARLWLRLAAWYSVHVAYFMRRPSASATLGLHHLTHLQSQRWCLSAGTVVQLVSVTCVWPAPALLLMQAAVSADAHSLNQMTTCVNADVCFHRNLPSPLSAFGLTPPWCGRPLYMTPLHVGCGKICLILYI